MFIPAGMPSPSGQPLRAERDFRAGQRAWLRGDLDRAVTLLEKASLEAPGSPDPRLFLSRALAERNEVPRALSVIDQAIAIDPAGESGPLFRAIILLDSGDPGAAAALAGATRSYLGSALLALNERREKEPLVLPAPARWIPDAKGRLLARLEASLFARGADAWIDAHHPAFAGDVEPAPFEENFLQRTLRYFLGASPDTDPFRSAKAWWAALDSAFFRKDYAGVLDLQRNEKCEPWQKLPSRIAKLFSLLARGEDGKARSFALELRRKHPTSVDVHFLEGLAHVRAGRTAESAWSFARAARFADLEVDEIALSVAGKLEQIVRWTDETGASLETTGNPG